MRRLAFIAPLAFGVLVSTACHAQPASHASVETLFSLMDLENSIDSTFDKMQSIAKQSLASLPKGQAMTPEQRARFEDAMARTNAMMRDELTWAKLEPEFVEIYASTFTQAEIDGQIAFYRTPAGQALIAKTPQLTDKTLAATQARMQALLPRIQETMRAAMQRPETASAPEVR